ncbi:PucR family transcriptional regulator [Nocardioides speluncae]|uniref:PucR family transcriptional regulator n=1 Tax=Nocardioides speluncae TaxID=2670337 RepID=UPI000D692289|nr:PucR family transcriptional regulator [Nocardioides speluncae]
MVDVALLLEQPELVLRAVHLPRPDAEIRWVATSELEDPTRFLEGGELLLTTGLATKGWRGQWDEYVARLARVGVSSLALGVGLTHARVPATLLTACEKHGLNLLEVPRETAFVTVSRATAGLIDERDEGEARLALETQRQLTSAAVRNDGQRAVVGRLAQLLDGCAFLLTADGRLAAGPTGPRPELADVDAALAELAKIRAEGLRAASSASDEHRTSLLLPVGLRGRPAYYLAVAVPGRVTDVRRNAVTTAVALLGLAAEQERGRLDTQRRLWQKMYELLVRGQVEAVHVVGEAAELPALPAQVRVVRAAGGADVLDDALGELERRRVLATVHDGVLRLVAAPARATRAAERLSVRGLTVGLGEIAELAAAATSDTTARLALERATVTTGVVRWDSVVREGAVGLLAADVAASFSASFFGGLDDEQTATLGSFLKHHGSRLKVAEELGLHRNTVRNRVAQIELAIGRSLDDPDTRAAAWLAWQARDLPGSRHG